jgi:hypothetical protein
VPAWPELQDAFASALRDPAAPPPGAIGKTAGSPPVRRFSVYRNNVAVGLIGALADNYPVTARLVGGAVFRDLAVAFTAAHPPKSPLMQDFGAGLADFLESYPPADRLPWLADMARLERAWLCAYHAADAEPAGIGALGAIAEEALAEAHLSLHPAARLVCSPFPVASIWHAHQGDDVGAALRSLPEGGEDTLVTRPDGDVEIRRLPPGAAAFVRALGDGAPFAAAAEAGLGAAKDFDLGAALAMIFEAGAVIAVET